MKSPIAREVEGELTTHREMAGIFFLGNESFKLCEAWRVHVIGTKLQEGSGEDGLESGDPEGRVSGPRLHTPPPAPIRVDVGLGGSWEVGRLEGTVRELVGNPCPG